MEELKQQLSEYGLVRTCKKVHDDVVTVCITDGFNENVLKTMECLGKIQDAFPEHKTLETCVTEENFCLVVLKK
jgi:fatty acid/phospholipid biosynthesis enzyme